MLHQGETYECEVSQPVNGEPECCELGLEAPADQSEGASSLWAGGPSKRGETP